MNKYSQLLKKLGLSAAALALSATLAVDSASATDENATDETVEQNVEADTTTEEKTEVLSEEKATEATTEKAVEEKAPEATQPEETDRLLGRTPVPHVNYNHAYFTHKTSKTGNSEWAYISFYINGFPYSQTSHNVSSDGKIHGSITYDDLRDLVEEQVKGYDNGVVLDKLDENPYDNYYSYYFVDADKLSTDGETTEKPAADKQEEQQPEAPAKEKPAEDKKEESFDDLRPLEELPLGGHASSFDKNGFPINWSEAKKQAYIEKFGLPKGADKQGSVQSDKQDSELVAKRKDLLARVEASDLTESAKKQLIEVINDLELKNILVELKQLFITTKNVTTKKLNAKNKAKTNNNKMMDKNKPKTNNKMLKNKKHVVSVYQTRQQVLGH